MEFEISVPGVGRTKDSYVIVNMSILISGFSAIGNCGSPRLSCKVAQSVANYSVTSCN